MTEISEAIDYCRHSMREADYEHYLISIMMPHHLRPALWVMGAFQSAIDAIPSVVSGSTLGLIRLTWWRDQIIALMEGRVTQGQPVLTALHDTIPLDILPLLIEYINEQEAFFEDDGIIKPSSALPKIHEKMMGTHYLRFQTLQNHLTTLLKKYHGTRWEAHPPFLAFRLWFKQLLLT